MIGRLVVWKACGRRTVSCRYYPKTFDLRVEKPRSLGLKLGPSYTHSSGWFLLVAILNRALSDHWRISMQLMAQWWLIRGDTSLVILLEASSVAKPSRELFITHQASVSCIALTTFLSDVAYFTNHTVSGLITSILEFGCKIVNCRTRSDVMPPRRLGFIIPTKKVLYNQPCPSRGLDLHI
jgi:hypothetical protein